MKSFCLMLLLTTTLAQANGSPSPYADQAAGAIKALSDEEQSALREGQGLGFAKAAELNGYPGPKHVLELAAPLELSEAQRRASQALFERMREAARATGAELIEAERALDALYASRTATTAAVTRQLAVIESLRSRLRGIHLDAHLEQAALLSAEQIASYARLRGYGAGQHGAHH